MLLPADPDASARALRRSLGCAILITDSFGRPWRVGQAEVAIGCAGLAPAEDWRGRDDADGRELAATVIAVADEAAAAADLARGKDTREPAIRIRGLERYVTSDDGAGAAALIRALADDLFPLGRPCLAAIRASNRSRASSTRLPCASDHEPSAFSGGAIVAPSGVSAYSTRGGTSACTRRATTPSRSMLRSVCVSTFSEIGWRSSSSSW